MPIKLFSRKKGVVRGRSTAFVVTVAVHAAIFLVAGSYVALSVLQREEPRFEGKQIARPKMKVKKLQVPIKVKKIKQPKFKQPKAAPPKVSSMDFKMPAMGGIKGGMGSFDGGRLGSLGFRIPKINFFGAKSQGGNVVFIVHFGPATSGATPYERMTSYTIRKRLQEMIDGLPEYTLFNVTAYWQLHCTPFSDKLLPATPSNKKQLLDWMEPVNPVEGQAITYGSGFSPAFRKRLAKLKWPNRLDKEVPPFGPKWYYNYRVPKEINAKYLPDSKQGFIHWSRALTWALQTQNPDTIFILTTNYISDAPETMVSAYKQMCRDLFGPDRKEYPTVNVVVLARAGVNPQKARNILEHDFDPIISFFKGDGNVIKDIKNHMNKEERKRLKSYLE
jgi:hypothetical protein